MKALEASINYIIDTFAFIFQGLKVQNYQKITVNGWLSAQGSIIHPVLGWKVSYKLPGLNKCPGSFKFPVKTGC